MKNNFYMHSSSVFAVLLAIMIANPHISYSGENSKNGHSSDRFQNPETSFKKAKEILLQRYQDRNLTEEALYQAAVQGMLSSLNEDDHQWNKLFSPKELKEMEKEDASEFAGIGIVFNFLADTGLIQVLRLTPGSPAEKNGIHVDDNIVSVNGKTYREKKIIDVVHDIRGRVGDSIHLKILRGDQIISKSFKLESIHWNPVESEILPHKIGLLYVYYFGENTPDLIRSALDKFKNAGVRGLIVDLRYNDGGVFDSAIRSSELFVPKGSTITTIIDRENNKEKKKSNQEPVFTENLPIALISNQYTAAGAELFASALIENRGATLVGEKTAGKWNVQTLEKLPNGFAIKYTTQNFLSPKGVSFHEIGLKPDLEVASKKDFRPLANNIEVRLTADAQLKAAVYLIREKK